VACDFWFSFYVTCEEMKGDVNRGALLMSVVLCGTLLSIISFSSLSDEVMFLG